MPAHKRRTEYLPRRQDHFPSVKALAAWLRDHSLPVSQRASVNVATMLRATGGR